MENARVGNVDSRLLGKSCGKRSFWKSSISVFRKSRGKRSFWKSSISVFAKVSRGKRAFWEERGLKPRFQTTSGRKGLNLGFRPHFGGNWEERGLKPRFQTPCHWAVAQTLA